MKHMFYYYCYYYIINKSANFDYKISTRLNI